MSATIVIPTYNRPRHLRRLLRFLEALGNPYRVLVLDGSAPDNAARNARLADEHAQLTLRQYPSELHQGLRYADGLQHVATPYVAICGDDDFIVPSAVRRCVEFMDDHREYSAVIGRVMALHYSTARPILRWGYTISNPLAAGFNLSHRWFLQRMLHLLAHTATGCPPLFYALRRTEQARRAFALVTPQIRYSAQELLTNAVTLLLGRATVLPCLFGLRDYASDTIREPMRDDPDSYFSPGDLAYLRTVLVPMIVEIDGLSPETAGFAASLFLEHVFPRDPAPAAGVRAVERRWRQRARTVASTLQSLLLPASIARRHEFEASIARALRLAQLEFARAPLPSRSAG
jgi:glycosyltransferase domain-containing protein